MFFFLLVEEEANPSATWGTGTVPPAMADPSIEDLQRRSHELLQLQLQLNQSQPQNQHFATWSALKVGSYKVNAL